MSVFVRVNAICESRMAQTTSREVPPNVINFVNKFTLLSTLLLLIFYQRINDLLLGSHIIFPYQCLAMFHVYIPNHRRAGSGTRTRIACLEGTNVSQLHHTCILGNFISPYNVCTNVYILFLYQGLLYNIPNLD